MTAKIFDDEETAEKAKRKLEEVMSLDPYYDSTQFNSLELNWVEGDDYKNWEDVKAESKELMSKENNERNIFLAHSRDIICGKPQLVHTTMKTIVLLRKVIKVDKGEGGDGSVSTNWKFLDDSYDKRYDGNCQYEWSQDFWIYRIIHKSKDYYIFSKQELEMKNYEFTGMIVDLNDRTEMNNNLKLKSVSRVFFMKTCEPTVKILSKEKIVELTKELKLTKETWFDFLNLHPLNTINKFPESTNLMRSAQILSGKMDGWPLHLAVMGKPGTRKSFGYIETTAYKFGDDTEIVEGANSRIKGLSPSFKEKPANIGYLARAERMGFIDELGKMVEFEMNKHQSGVTNVLGELNFLLDQKKRTVGSGNDNDCIVQANAKFLFATNGVRGKDYISNHIGLIDPTTMSRIIWWVQDEDEINLVLSKKGIERIPPTPTQAQEGGVERERVDMLVYVLGENRDSFLTVFDTCNSFICKIDPLKVQDIARDSILASKEPMKSIWRSRSEHHISLIIDGLVKFRCLFEDYDNTFKPIESDYVRAKALVYKMVKNWDSMVSIRNNFEAGL